MLKKILFIGVALMFVMASMLGYAVFVMPIITKPTIITITQNSSLKTIGNMLVERNIIDNIYIFYGLSYIQKLHTRIPAGELVLEPPLTLWQLPNAMVEAKQQQHAITLKEGVSVAVFLDILRESHNVITYDIASSPKEGSLLANTYYVPKKYSARKLIMSMQKALQNYMANAMPIAKNHPLQHSNQILILASLIEKEAAVIDELPRIAGVFINRLRRNMRLQTDPSVIYGLSHYTGNLGRPLTRRDLTRDHPWNSYTRHGLPPTPITNVGKAAIAAALHPEKHEYYYFVANNDGTHSFSRTYDEHRNHIRRIKNSKN